LADSSSSFLLPAKPDVEELLAQQVRQDHERFARTGLPKPFEPFLRKHYQIDVASTYAGLPVKNPWGKASGQLSMTLAQVEEDVEAGLGFIVLKTVIAEDAQGGRAMAAWALPESRMMVEPIVGRSGASGWTVTWKGRGWWQSFEAYLDLVRQATSRGQEGGTLVVPSCKYHLPAPGESGWRTGEYEFTTQQLCQASPLSPLPIEKDFSPTLAGSELARQRDQILHWLAEVPRLIRQAAPRPVRIGLKLFNSMFDDCFQVEMLRRSSTGADRPDYLVYGNRLFDPERLLEGHRGVAYGGPDLSARNLLVLDLFRKQQQTSTWPEISGTGDIHSGKMALEYALRGCTTFQMHTLFQLPLTAYEMRRGSRTERALHRLYFHPEHGFVLWLHHLAKRLPLQDSSGIVHFDRVAQQLAVG
jgi:hypothetical protein